MNWDDIKKAAGNGIQPVTGGFTKAKRGIVTLEDGKKVFVKIAVDEMTQAWLDKEIHAYKWLNTQGSTSAPTMLAYGDDGMALDDLSAWDWSDSWDYKKVAAALKCMTDLNELSEKAKEAFVKNDHFGPNPWKAHNYSLDTYGWVKNNYPDQHKKLQSLLHDEKFLNTVMRLASNDPWEGDDLVHFDARSDNFAYNKEDGRGVFVDWNWACLGNAVFDRAALLVNIQKSGFDVVKHFPEYLDPASLAWICGFWVMALYNKVDNDPALQGMRTHQIESLLVTESMLRKLLA